MDELTILRMCALLHDIGKLECWANNKPWSEHIHWTYKFVKECFGEDYAVTSMRHHTGISCPKEYYPQTECEKIICLADNLSSGADIREEPEKGVSLPKPPFHLTHVLSKGDVILQVIDSAFLDDATREIMNQVKGLKAVFDKDSRSGYLNLFEVLATSRLKVIPTDTRSPINDVSLWDHLKLTAAFASCIWLDGGYRGDDLDKYEFALIRGDADKISRFVNLSSRLPDLNARSERIRVATEKAGTCVTELLGPECLIFAGGGGLLAISPVNTADKVSETVKSSFETATQGLVTLTVNYLKSSGVEMQKGFGKIWKEAQWRMRLKKSERPVGFVERLSDDVKACDICHVRPMAREDAGKMLPYDASPRPERLCKFCWRLREEGRGVRLDEFKEFEGEQERSNYVAIIKADGDKIGKVLGGDTLEGFEKVATPSRLSAISRHIHDVCENKLEKIVSKARGRCLIAGGDDILAIVPGEESLETARRIAVEFKSEMAEACTMSAGVAIFRYDLPIYAGLEAADRLLRMAKESEFKGSVAFAIIGGVGIAPDELENIKHGPRKWSKLEEILSLSKTMVESGLASTQIRKIAGTAKKDPMFAEILIKSLMGKGEKGKGVSWSEGERFLSYLKSGILLDAFAVYNAFKVKET